MNDFEKGYVLGSMDNDDLPEGGCFSNMVKILGFGVLIIIGAILAVLILLRLIGSW